MMKPAFLLSCSFSITFLILLSCNDYKKNKSHRQTSDASIRSGEKLSKQYCASCHQFPEPSLLDSKSWEHGVLPQMGPRLGIFYFGDKTYPSYKNDLNVKEFYPSQPVISLEDWQHILDYYSAASPDSLLSAEKNSSVKMSNEFFKPVQPSFAYPKPATSFVKIQSHDQLITCDAIAKKIFVFDADLQLKDSINTSGSVTDLIADSNKIIICNTGVLNPNNGKYGSVEKIIIDSLKIVDTVFKNLMRPVQIVRTDINHDGRSDYIICEFGNLVGALSWLENKDSGKYEYHVLRALPGSIKVCVDDYNHDGLPDLWALFSQGNEGVFLFTNKGNGVFDTKQILQFPPSYGSSSFELDDFNKDGYPDIIYTCGDNADYSPVLKPYHGVYIFFNDGKNNFSQKFFYPINGCYKAIAKDFDNDGDLDIATISFFADYKNQPEEGFIYFKNEGDLKFQPYSLPEAKQGRWLTMDAGDFDGDGKIDLVLGNFSIVGSFSKSSVDWKNRPPFLLLKNIQ